MNPVHTEEIQILLPGSGSTWATATLHRNGSVEIATDERLVEWMEQRYREQQKDLALEMAAGRREVSGS